MKKILAFLLAATMLCALFVLPSSAADNKNYEVSFKYIKSAPKIDGTVKANEYGSALPFHTYSTSKSQFKDREHNKLVGQWDVDFYTAWDKNNLYMAWVVKSDAHGALPNAQFKEAPANAGEPIEGTKISDNPEAAAQHMWTYSHVSFIITPGAPNAGVDYSANYLEVGFCEDVTGSTQRAIWKVPTSMQLDEVNLNDWSAVAKRDEAKKTTTYEIAIPWKYAGVNAIGNKQKFGLAYAVGAQEYYFKDNRAEMAMIEWQDAILSTKFPNRCAVVTLTGAPTNDVTTIHKELKPGTLPSSANGKPQIGITNINEGITADNEATLITDPSQSLESLNWSYSVLLKKTDEAGVYELVTGYDGVMGSGSPVSFGDYKFEKGMLVLGVHTDNKEANSVAWSNTVKALLPGSKLGIFGVDLAKNERTYSNSMFYVIEEAKAPVVDDPSQDPSDEPSKDPVDEPSKDPVDEPSKDPVDEPSKDPVDEPSKDPVTSDEPTTSDEPATSDEPTSEDPSDVVSDDVSDGSNDVSEDFSNTFESEDESSVAPSEAPAASEDDADANTNTNTNTTNDDKKEEDDGNGALLWIIIGVVVVAAGGAGAFFFLKKKKA